MTKKEDVVTSSYNQVMFPTGWLDALGAVMAMLAALAIMWLLSSLLVLADFQIGVRAVVSMTGVALLTLILAHPTFMLVKGQLWPRPFLVWLNGFCIIFLVIGTAVHLLRGNESLFHLGLLGLLFAFAAFKLYRSRNFSEFCAHYVLLRRTHNAKRQPKK